MRDKFTGSDGFTILELLVTISLVVILSAIVLSAPMGMRSSSRDQERIDDVASLVRRLEQAYTGQEIGGPAYPSTSEYQQDIWNKTRTIKRLDLESLKAPDATNSSSVSMAQSNSTTAPMTDWATNNYTRYVYQPLTSDGSLCTANNSINSSTTTCVRFNYYYRSEKDGQIHRVASLHQQ